MRQRRRMTSPTSCRHLLILLLLTFTTSSILPFVSAKKDDETIRKETTPVAQPQPQPSFVQLAESQLGNLLVAPPTTPPSPTPPPLSPFLQLAALPLNDLALQIEDEETTLQQQPARNTQLECPSTLTTSEVFDSSTTFYYAMVLPPTTSTTNSENDGILCGRLEVINDGWIGVALSNNGKMDGSIAIIGMPQNTVKKYDLVSYGANLSTKQTLMDTSFTQQGSKMIMTFTKLLSEENEVSIKQEGITNVLFARGGESLGFHSMKLSSFIRFSDGIVVDQGTTVTVCLYI